MRRTREKYALRKGEAALEESWHRSAAPVTTFARTKLEKNPARINSVTRVDGVRAKCTRRKVSTNVNSTTFDDVEIWQNFSPERSHRNLTVMPRYPKVKNSPR